MYNEYKNCSSIYEIYLSLVDINFISKYPLKKFKGSIP